MNAVYSPYKIKNKFEKNINWRTNIVFLIAPAGTFVLAGHCGQSFAQLIMIILPGFGFLRGRPTPARSTYSVGS
jgi:hypothetical protein